MDLKHWVTAGFFFQKAREGCGCLKCLAGKVFQRISTLLENDSLIFRQHEMLSLPRLGHFPARKMAAGKWIFSSETAAAFLSFSDFYTELALKPPGTVEKVSGFLSQRFLSGGYPNFGAKKNNKQKTHKHFSDGPYGTIVPGTNLHLSQGQTGQNGDSTVEFKRERPVYPRDGSHFVPGTVPVCPGQHLCLLVFLARQTTGLASTNTVRCRTVRYLIQTHFSRYL